MSTATEQWCKYYTSLRINIVQLNRFDLFSWVVLNVQKLPSRILLNKAVFEGVHEYTVKKLHYIHYYRKYILQNIVQNILTSLLLRVVAICRPWLHPLVGSINWNNAWILLLRSKKYSTIYGCFFNNRSECSQNVGHFQLCLPNDLLEIYRISSSPRTINCNKMHNLWLTDYRRANVSC